MKKIGVQPRLGRREILIRDLITVLFDNLFPSRFDKLLGLLRKSRLGFFRFSLVAIFKKKNHLGKVG